jgi:hypothetical protein
MESLRDKRLKIARFSGLNDPFDFLGIGLDYPSQRHTIRQMKDLLEPSVGLLCMSTTWQEPLLWGHYADKHKGICLGFDVDGRTWRKVNYVDVRPRLEDFKKKFVADLTTRDIYRISTTKFKAWAYEAEYRRFIQLRTPDLVTGLYFRKFSKAMRLAEVIVGDRCTATREQITRLCEHNGGNIALKKARPAFNTFEVVEQKREDMWA